MGTTTLALVVTVFLPLSASLAVRFIREGFASMKDHLMRSLGGGVIWAIATWTVFFGWNVVKVIYTDHQLAMVRIAQLTRSAPTPAPEKILLIAHHQFNGSRIPLPIAAHSIINVIQISNGGLPLWGVWPVHNDGDKARLWPSWWGKRQPQFICQYSLSNFSGTPILGGELMLTIERKRTPTGPSLDVKPFKVAFDMLGPSPASSPFTFYVINESKLFVVVAWPQTAQVLLAGESVSHPVPIDQPGINLLDKLASCPMFPSKVNWPKQ